MAARNMLVALALAAGTAVVVRVRQAAREAASTPAGVTAAVDALIARHWTWRMRNNPELAAFFGVDPGSGAAALDDRSVAAYEALGRHATAMLAELAALPDTPLPAAASLRRRLFKEQLEGVRDGLKFRAFLMPVSNLEGPQVDFAAVLGWLMAGDTPQTERAIAALQAFPAQMDQILALLRTGIKEGRVLPLASLRSVPSQVMSLIKDPSPLYEPFSGCSDEVKQRAMVAIETGVVNAFSKLLNFLHIHYFPAAEARGTSIACSDLPDGKAMYQACLRFHTSTDLTADEIHEMGLSEVKRIRAAMVDVMHKCRFTGTLAEFAEDIGNDPRFVCKTSDELLKHYQTIMDHVQSKLPLLFNVLPSTECALRAMSPEKAKSAPAAYYYAGTADGKRPGVFYANTDNLPARKVYEMEALTLHEAIPGHHLQTTLAIENKDLAVFQAHIEDRRYGEAPGRFPLYSAYVEGWGLYSEALGHEIEGVYTSPYSHFGQLSMEMLRACRLVVDTGMHHLGWSTDKAVAYVVENTMMEVGGVRNEINRYVTWPGQACGYKIGQMKIGEVRARAEANLGDAFDIRAFHDLVVGMGSVPLGVLEDVVEEWVHKQLAPAAST